MHALVVAVEPLSLPLPREACCIVAPYLSQASRSWNIIILCADTAQCMHQKVYFLLQSLSLTSKGFSRFQLFLLKKVLKSCFSPSSPFYFCLGALDRRRYARVVGE